MATKQLRATTELVEGDMVLVVETMYEFGEVEAATALAIVYRRQPLWSGTNKLRDGLRRAAEDAVLAQPDLVEAVSPVAVAKYRKRLTSEPQIMFPGPTLRAQMLATLRQGQEAWRALDRASRPANPLGLKLPNMWAKHDSKKTGEPVVQVDIPRYYRLDDAALALAIVHRDDLVPRASRTQTVPQADYILRDQLRLAGEEYVLTNRRRVARVDQGLVADYRAMLLDTGVFEPPPTP